MTYLVSDIVGSTALGGTFDVRTSHCRSGRGRRCGAGHRGYGGFVPDASEMADRHVRSARQRGVGGSGRSTSSMPSRRSGRRTAPTEPAGTRRGSCPGSCRRRTLMEGHVDEDCRRRDATRGRGDAGAMLVGHRAGVDPRPVLSTPWRTRGRAARRLGRARGGSVQPAVRRTYDATDTPPSHVVRTEGRRRHASSASSQLAAR